MEYTPLQDGRATLYCGDCLDVLPSIPSESVDAIITDPPYVLGAYSSAKKKGAWTDLENAARFFALWMEEGKRTLKQTGYMIVFGNYRCLPSLVRAALLADLDVVNVLIWDKEYFGPAHVKQLRTSYELALVVAMPLAKIEDRRARDVIKAPWPAKRETNHPAEKPIELFLRLVQLVCQPEGTVLDMFMGSGTTGKAALMSNRKFIGIESERKYFDFARERLSASFEEGLVVV